MMIDITIAYGLNTVLTEGNVGTRWGFGFSFVATDACYFSGKTLTGVFTSCDTDFIYKIAQWNN